MKKVSVIMLILVILCCGLLCGCTARLAKAENVPKIGSHSTMSEFVEVVDDLIVGYSAVEIGVDVYIVEIVTVSAKDLSTVEVTRLLVDLDEEEGWRYAPLTVDEVTEWKHVD